MTPLHHIWVSETPKTASYVLVLHGILGSGQNFRSLAQKINAAHPEHALALVDLRFHGRSGPRPGPQTLRAAADDLVALERTLPGRCIGVMGHSFGGKVATVYASQRAADLQRLWVLDSPPGARANGAGSESTMAILDMLQRAPRHWPDRRAFVDHVASHGHPRGIGQWLAMNLARGQDGYELAIDIGAIRALLDDYFQTDMWPFLETTDLPLSLVLGERTEVFDAAERARVDALARTRRNARVHVVPEAAHWLHVDNPAGTLAAILEDWPAQPAL